MRVSSNFGEPQKPGGVGWTWIASAPIALARSNARWRPPDESTCAPSFGIQKRVRPVPSGLLKLVTRSGRSLHLRRPSRPGAIPPDEIFDFAGAPDGAEACVDSCARSVSIL